MNAFSIFSQGSGSFPGLAGGRLKNKYTCQKAKSKGFFFYFSRIFLKSLFCRIDPWYTLFGF